MSMRGLMAVCGAVGSFIAGAFGGWTTSLTTLCILMFIDFITGVVRAVLWQNSTKTDDGAYSSATGYKGIAKKFFILVIVYIAHRIDIEIGANYLRDGVAIAYIVNEAMSIIENLGMMGVPVPDILMQGISVLKSRNKDKDDTINLGMFLAALLAADVVLAFSFYDTYAAALPAAHEAGITVETEEKLNFDATYVEPTYNDYDIVTEREPLTAIEALDAEGNDLWFEALEDDGEGDGEIWEDDPIEYDPSIPDEELDIVEEDVELDDCPEGDESEDEEWNITETE